MKNSDYWKERFLQLEEARHKKGLKFCDKIAREYAFAVKKIEADIDRWYRRIAENNNVSMARARKLLSQKELKEFKWDVEEYIRRGKENAANGSWMKELENASARFHISRLEALKLHIRAQVEELSEVREKLVTESHGTTFYHTAYEIQKGLGIGCDMEQIDAAQLKTVITKPWTADKYNFSERIWNSKNRLISELHTQLTRDIMLGRSARESIAAISKAMDSSKSNAERLVLTERAYMASLSAKECYERLDVERYMILATLDSRTSEVCRNLDGKVMPVKDYQAGVTAPPFHPRCRTTTVPYSGEDYGIAGTRIARDSDTGQTYYVPEDMTYREWEEKFVKGGDKSDLVEYADRSTTAYSRKKLDHSGESGIMELGNRETAVNDMHYIGKIDVEKYKCVTPDITTDEVIITDERIEHIKSRHSGDFDRIKPFLLEILQSPDYILEDNKNKNTGLILKEINENNSKFQMVLRLHTSIDEKGYKNSVISAWEISQSRWNNYLRNKKILYKSE